MPKAPPSEKTPNLYKRPNSAMYYARVRVPPGANLKRSHLTRSLRTAKLSEAKSRLPHVVAELKAEIERARRSPAGSLVGTNRKTLEEEALWWQTRLAEGGASVEREIDWRREEILGDPVGEAFDEAGAPYPIYDPERERAFDKFNGLVTGERVPVDFHLSAFTAKEISSRYISRIRRVTTLLSEWLSKRPGGDNIRAVGRASAAEFVDYLAAQGRAPKTTQSLISALSSYWAWLDKRDAVKDNPWRGHDIPRVRKRAAGGKRPFTDEEIKALLTGPASQTLADLMRLAALTGMRLNEIGSLTVGNSQGGFFNITKSKTEAGVRRVPIHPALKALVERRTKGKTNDDFLLEELKAPPSRPDERAAKAGERFTAYRRTVRVDDAPEGQKQSNVDFHSFRRWFITKAEQAGQPPHLISTVVGHKVGRQGLTLSVYSQGPSDEQRKAVVEAVKLPNGVG